MALGLSVRVISRSAPARNTVVMQLMSITRGWKLHISSFGANAVRQGVDGSVHQAVVGEGTSMSHDIFFNSVEVLLDRYPVLFRMTKETSDCLTANLNEAECAIHRRHDHDRNTNNSSQKQRKQTAR